MPMSGPKAAAARSDAARTPSAVSILIRERVIGLPRVIDSAR